MTKEQPSATNKFISTKRDYTWLWMYITRHYGNTYIGELNSPGMRKSLDNAWDNFEPEELLLQMKASFLPINDYSWIKNDAFQLDWLSKKLLLPLKKDLYTVGSEKIDIDYIVGLFDSVYSETILLFKESHYEYIQRRQKNQKEIVRKIRLEWNETSNYQKQFKWFNGEDKSNKIAVGWQIFCNKVKDAKEIYNKFESLHELLNTFDMLQVSTENRKLFLIEVQARYRQNKWRAKKQVKRIPAKLVDNKTTNNPLAEVITQHAKDNAESTALRKAAAMSPESREGWAKIKSGR